MFYSIFASLLFYQLISLEDSVPGHHVQQPLPLDSPGRGHHGCSGAGRCELHCTILSSLAVSKLGQTRVLQTLDSVHLSCGGGAAAQVSPVKEWNKNICCSKPAKII